MHRGGAIPTTEPLATCVAVVEALRDGRYKEACDVFGPQLRAVAPAKTVRTAWTAEVVSRGAVTAIGAPVSERAEARTVVRVPVTCERGGLVVVMSVDDATGLLNGLRLAPAGAGEPWEPPAYADPSAFDEQEVLLGSGPLAVPGTLSLPRVSGASGERPAVVLLSGGGPFDRDETSGCNKPLKDLAWGLASRGIAVLRFDKVTYAHPGPVADDHGFTAADEYIPHAVEAIRLLQRHPAVAAGRVFVLGHSMGGKIAPRVAAAAPEVAGMVVMAGDTSPMQWAAVRVTRYLASLDPGPGSAAAAQSAIETLTKQAEMVDSPGLGPATPADRVPLGWSAAYWLDLRGYDAVGTAAVVNKPMLILQGGRDYQVTVADDLAGWRAGLAGRADVDIRVYEADDHMFFPGAGPSSPERYAAPQHVDPAVVADVADWIAGESAG